MAWMVYLARCRDGTLYTGVTTDPERRLKQHNQGLGAAYTRSRLPVTLVYQEPAGSRSEALRRERAIKALSRTAKEALLLQSGGSALAPAD
jgi:putative endonuclease